MVLHFNKQQYRCYANDSSRSSLTMCSKHDNELLWDQFKIMYYLQDLYLYAHVFRVQKISGRQPFLLMAQGIPFYKMVVDFLYASKSMDRIPYDFLIWLTAIVDFHLWPLITGMLACPLAQGQPRSWEEIWSNL